VKARLSAEDEEYLRRSCEESGVPRHVTDPVALGRAASRLAPGEVERIRQSAIVNGRRERREQGIPERIDAEAMTAKLSALLSTQT